MGWIGSQSRLNQTWFGITEQGLRKFRRRFHRHPNPFPVELSLTCPYSIIRTDSFHAAGYRVPAAACDYIYTLTASATSSAPPSLGHTRTRTRPLRARLAAPPRLRESPCRRRTLAQSVQVARAACRRARPIADVTTTVHPPSPLGRYRGQIPFRPPKPKHYYQEEDASDY